MRLCSKSLFSASFLLLVAAALSVRAENGDVEISYSYYLISCDGFQQHRDEDAAPGVNSAADSFYAAGWISAYNRLRPGTPIPEDTTLDDVMLWLDGYCMRHPEGNLEAGLFELAEEAKPRSASMRASEKRPSPPRMKKPEGGVSPPVPLNGLKPLPE